MREEQEIRQDRNIHVAVSFDLIPTLIDNKLVYRSIHDIIPVHQQGWPNMVEAFGESPVQQVINAIKKLSGIDKIIIYGDFKSYQEDLNFYKINQEQDNNKFNSKNDYKSRFFSFFKNKDQPSGSTKKNSSEIETHWENNLGSIISMLNKMPPDELEKVLVVNLNYKYVNYIYNSTLQQLLSPAKVLSGSSFFNLAYHNKYLAYLWLKSAKIKQSTFIVPTVSVRDLLEDRRHLNALIKDPSYSGHLIMKPIDGADSEDVTVIEIDAFIEDLSSGKLKEKADHIVQPFISSIGDQQTLLRANFLVHANGSKVNVIPISIFKKSVAKGGVTKLHKTIVSKLTADEESKCINQLKENIEDTFGYLSKYEDNEIIGEIFNDYSSKCLRTEAMNSLRLSHGCCLKADDNGAFLKKATRDMNYLNPYIIQRFSVSNIEKKDVFYQTWLEILRSFLEKNYNNCIQLWEFIENRYFSIDRLSFIKDISEIELEETIELPELQLDPERLRLYYTLNLIKILKNKDDSSLTEAEEAFNTHWYNSKQSSSNRSIKLVSLLEFRHEMFRFERTYLPEPDSEKACMQRFYILSGLSSHDREVVNYGEAEEALYQAHKFAAKRGCLVIQNFLDKEKFVDLKYYHRLYCELETYKELGYKADKVGTLLFESYSIILCSDQFQNQHFLLTEYIEKLKNYFPKRNTKNNSSPQLFGTTVFKKCCDDEENDEKDSFKCQ